MIGWVHPAAISRTRNILLSAPVNALLALLPLAVVPIYIRLLGSEAYGLVVLNATILATILFLDRLMGPAIIREFGRKNGDPSEAAEMGNLLRSFEGVALALGGLAAAAAFAVLPFLTAGWREKIGLDAAGLWLAFSLMSVSIGFQWPGLLYAAGLIGLQRQALAAFVRLGGALALHGGGIIVLLFVRTDVLALLAWQATVVLVLSWTLRKAAWSAMPPSAKAPMFDADALRGVWRMAVGSLLIGLAAALIAQIDKLMVARLSQPDQFLAYGLSFMAAGAALNVPGGPLATAMQPHFAQLVAGADHARLADAYHRWSQVLALMAVPLAGVLIAFAAPLVEIWLGADAALSAQVKTILPMAALGVLLITLLAPAAVLQGAAGWNGLILGCHTATIMVLAATLPTVLDRYGPWGAAALGATLTGSYFFVMTPLMHRKLLRGQFWRATLMNVAVPLAAAAAVFGLSAQFPAPASRFAALAHGVATAGAAFTVLLLILPQGRAQLHDSIAFLRAGGRR